MIYIEIIFSEFNFLQGLYVLWFIQGKAVKPSTVIKLVTIYDHQIKLSQLPLVEMLMIQVHNMFKCEVTDLQSAGNLVSGLYDPKAKTVLVQFILNQL